LLSKLNAEQLVVGTRRLSKAIECGNIACAYVAMDADLFIVRKITDLCAANDVRLIQVPTMKELGQVCSVQVPTASAGLRK
jgi:Ribosomal protein HS6-type (S12/L30/L7a)